MPDARCIRGPVCKMGRENAHEHTGSAEASDIPCAMALRLIPRSPRRRIRLVTVIGELTECPRPVGPTLLHRLDTSNGCQDHTASPYAATSFVCAPFDRSRVWLNPKPALQFTCTPNAAASTASNPASVTIAIRPLCPESLAEYANGRLRTNRPSLELSPYAPKVTEPVSERGTDPVSSSTRTVARASSPNRARKGVDDGTK